MRGRDEIRQLALAVGSALTAYIDVHNRIFREGASLKSVVKNLFGRGVPMSQLLEESERLIPMWAGVQEQLDAFQRASYPTLTTDERSYLNVLTRYAAALTKTVRALVDRQRLLKDGSRRGRNNPMTWDLFQEKERIYKSAVAEYQAVGQDLNAAAPLVFD